LGLTKILISGREMNPSLPRDFGKLSLHSTEPRREGKEGGKEGFTMTTTSKGVPILPTLVPQLEYLRLYSPVPMRV
jgi:hypothetical protein